MFRESSNQPGGDEEVGVDDVRSLRRRGAPGKRQVTELPPGAGVENGEIDLVTACDESPLDLRNERPEVGRVRPGVHLGDEEDPHSASLRGAALAGQDDPGVPGPAPEQGLRRMGRKQLP